MKKTHLVIISSFLLITGCASIDQPVREPQKSIGMTQAHNEIRAKHLLKPLKWSAELTTYAQQWANFLARQNNCQMQHRPRSGKYRQIYGENIYWASPAVIWQSRNGKTTNRSNSQLDQPEQQTMRGSERLMAQNDRDFHTKVQTITPTKVVSSWANEKEDYSYTTNTCRPGKQCGHYTQLVWATTTEVGCGMALCTDKGQIWVCNYNPPGNYLGQKPY